MTAGEDRLKRPNILLIHTDQHRADCLGVYGNQEVKTPAIDELAAAGITYTNSYCSLPVCTPSRYSLLTGLYPHQHLGWSNFSNFPQILNTFPRMLQESGYNTKAVGKMHFKPTYLDVGFSEMELAEQGGPGRHDDDYHRYLRKNKLVDYIDLLDQVSEYRRSAPQEYKDNLGALESNLDEEDHKTGWIGEKALQELKKWDEGGNMLMVGFINPHHPFDPPYPWSEMYSPETVSLLPGWTEETRELDSSYHTGFFNHEGLTAEKVKQATAYYYACISQIDFQIGKMLELLKNKGIYNNTMIIFTSDHGEYLGYHHMLLKQNHLYEPLSRVPLIIKYPQGGQKENKQQFCRHQGVDKRLVSNIDLAPTILIQAGLQPDSLMRGLDLAGSEAERKFVFTESVRQQEYMVRGDRYKLLLNKKRELSQFFDLKEDPYELHNLINSQQYQEIINEFKGALYRWMLFEAPTPLHLNWEAKTIEQPNVLDRDDGHREESINYFQEKMREYLEGSDDK